MATTAQNNIVIELKRLPYAILTDGTADINQGDQVYLDQTAHCVKSLGASDDTNAAKFVGVAMASSYIQPYSQKKYQPQIPVLVSGVAYFNTTVGDTYHEGDDVWVGADAQTVTNTVGSLTKKLGIVKMLPNQAALAGAAGTQIQVEIAPLYPAGIA